jgi:predicted enzyme related to lactoylglutathione lyase
MSQHSVRVAYVNILANDPQRLADFYGRLFGFAEIEAHRSPIYRCLDANGVELGFNAPEAYGLLGIADRTGEGRAPVRAYFTIEVDAPEAVNAIAAAAAGQGGHVVKAPYDTYYNARQAVLEDPEGNVFRVNHRMGPRTPWAEIEKSGTAPFKLPTN